MDLINFILENGAEAILMIVLAIWGVILLAVLAFYILQSLGLYHIAKSRGIRHPWLAWLPIGTEWILGSIADQYQYVVNGRVKNRRMVLLVLQIVTMVLSLSNIAINLAPIFSIEKEMLWANVQLVISLGTSALSLATMIFWHICMWDLYNSMEPRDAVMYLIIGICLPVTEPFFIFCNRKKENGMPPRKPVAEEPQWQPQDPPEEPWDDQ